MSFAQPLATPKQKNKTNLDFSRFVLYVCGGDNKTRTYDLYDVNVAL